MGLCVSQAGAGASFALEAEVAPLKRLTLQDRWKQQLKQVHNVVMPTSKLLGSWQPTVASGLVIVPFGGGCGRRGWGGFCSNGAREAAESWAWSSEGGGPCAGTLNVVGGGRDWIMEGPGFIMFGAGGWLWNMTYTYVWLNWGRGLSNQFGLVIVCVWSCYNAIKSPCFIKDIKLCDPLRSSWPKENVG